MKIIMRYVGVVVILGLGVTMLLEFESKLNFVSNKLRKFIIEITIKKKINRDRVQTIFRYKFVALKYIILYF